MKNASRIKLAIFASGSGSNARKIIDYFKENELINVALVVSNKPSAGVLDHAELTSTPNIVANRDIFHSNEMLQILDDHGVDYIILAGFLKKIPIHILHQFHEKILNIHPALLPKYGGKGMYGMRVHKAVKESGDTISGMTIHQVNENYDEGKIIFQDSCDLTANDSAEDIAAKVLSLEHQHYAAIIEAYILDRLTTY